MRRWVIVQDREWYYIDQGEVIGPVNEASLQSLFTQKVIDENAYVWTTLMDHWAIAGQTSPFQEMFIRGKPSVRPWIRYWARAIDIVLISIATVLLGDMLFTSLVFLSDAIFTILVLFGWVFTEAYLLSSWGYTPGKWLMRIRVRDWSGAKISYKTALRRSFGVWWRGMGAGLPIVSFVTMLLSHRHLKNEGMAPWDQQNETYVFHGSIGFIRGFIVFCIILTLFVVAAI